MSDVERRLSALENRVSQLSTSEQLQPTYLTIDPATGLVSAAFSGKISASELDLIGGVGASPIRWLTTGGALLAQLTVDSAGDLILSPSGVIKSNGVTIPASNAGTGAIGNQVTWTRQSDGAVVGAIGVAGVGAGASDMFINSLWPGSGNSADLTVEGTPTAAFFQANAETSSHVATIEANSDTSGNSFVLASVDGNINTLVDVNNNSSFLKLPSNGNKIIQSVSVSAPIPAGWSSTFVTYPQTFSVQPDNLVATVEQTGGGASIVSFETSGINGASFGININSTIPQTVWIHYIVTGTP